MSCENINKTRDTYCETKDESLLQQCLFKIIQETYFFKTVAPRFNRFDPTHLDNPFQFKEHYYTLDFTTTNYTKHDNSSLLKDENDCSLFFNSDSLWLERQGYYLKSLSNYEIYTILGYTFHGDKIINYFIKGDIKNLLLFLKHCINGLSSQSDYFFPLFFQFITCITKEPNIYKKFGFHELYDSNDFIDKKLSIIYNKFKNYSDKLLTILENENIALKFWTPIIRLAMEDLNHTINNAPKTNKCFISFRGTQIQLLPRASSKYILHNTFMSTTLDLEIASQFKENECCLMRVIVPKGSSCLFVGGISKFTAELEILFSNNAVLQFVEPLYQTLNIEDPKNFDSDVYQMICKNRSVVNVSFLKFKGYYT